MTKKRISKVRKITDHWQGINYICITLSVVFHITYFEPWRVTSRYCFKALVGIYVQEISRLKGKLFLNS